ncbi:MAG: DUF4339 domain-containing protein [Prevotella sp.]|nr:DUF4339 domain-containing protein [Prevotella sp.]
MDNNDFFSLDRLLEFGIGMGMAQQMINMMNQSMKSMYIPGSIQSMPQPIAHFYYVAIDGLQTGPLRETELMELIRGKKVSKDTLAWMPGMATWLPVEQVPAILKLIALTPPPLNV